MQDLVRNCRRVFAFRRRSIWILRRQGPGQIAMWSSMRELLRRDRHGEEDNGYGQSAVSRLGIVDRRLKRCGAAHNGLGPAENKGKGQGRRVMYNL